MNIDQEQVDPAMEMENLEHAVTEMAETATNLNYWSGLFVQVGGWSTTSVPHSDYLFKLTNIYDEYSPPVVQVRQSCYPLVTVSNVE